MNIFAVIDFDRYAGKLLWVMVAGCVARFAAQSGVVAAAEGLFWIGLFVACLLARATLAKKSASHSTLQTLGNAAAALGLLLFLWRLSTTGLIPALLTLLLVAQAAMFLVADKRVHVLLVAGAAFGNVLFAAAESRNSLFLFAAAWFTFAVLHLLAFDMRSQREGEMVTVADSQTQRFGSGYFAVLVLTIAVPLYLFAPKPGGWMLGGMRAQTAHDYRDQDESDRARDAGRSDASSEAVESSAFDSSLRDRDAASKPTYDAELDVSNVQRDRNGANAIVMYVKSTQPVNLRGMIYDSFAGSRWYRTNRDAQRRELAGFRSRIWERPDVRGDTTIEQTIEVTVDLDKTLVHAPRLWQLRFPGPVVSEYTDGLFELPRPLRAGTTYSTTSRIDVLDGRYVDVDHDARTEEFTEVPEVSERVVELARNLIADAESTTDKALALEKYLRENHEYTFETVPYQGYTPIDWFLFEGKRGHCEYFASALAVMLRAVNVPSRLVTGFSLGERNPITGFYEVRAADGHAWVEAYIDGRGWLMLEPTPFYPLPSAGRESEQVARELDRYLNRLVEFHRTAKPDATKTKLIAKARDAWAFTHHVINQATQSVAALGWWLPVLVVLALLGLAGGALLWRWLQDVRSNRRVHALLNAEHATPRDAVVNTAAALELAAQPRSFRRAQFATMQEYVALLKRLDANTPLEFADTYDAVCYGEEFIAQQPQSVEQMARLIRASVTDQPHPRLVGLWRAWRQVIQDWLPARAVR